MITAARPMTMPPRPMLTSEKPEYCASRPPDSATIPLESARPISFIVVDVDTLSLAHGRVAAGRTDRRALLRTEIPVEHRDEYNRLQISRRQ